MKRLATLSALSLILAGVGCGMPPGTARAADAAADEGRDLGSMAGKLQKPVTSNFVGVPVSRILAFLQNATGVSFVLDPAIDDPSLEVKLENQSAKEALELVLELGGMDCEVRKGVVWVSRPERIAYRHRMAKRYDIREFLLAPLDYEGPEISAGGGRSSPGVSFDRVSEPDEDRAFNPEMLKEHIKALVNPESWSWEGFGIVAQGGFLEVTNTPQAHQRIQAYLEELRRTSGRMVALEGRYLSVDAGVWKSILGKEADKPSYFLDEAQSKALEEAVASGNASIVEQGRTTCYNAQRVNIATVRQRSYVMDYTTVVQVSTVGMDPDIGYMQDGMVLDLRPVILNEGKALHLEVRATLAGGSAATLREFSVPAPKATANAGKEGKDGFPAGEGASVGGGTLELPDMDFQTFRSTVRIPNGKTAIFASTSRMAGTKDKRILVLALKASVVQAE